MKAAIVLFGLVAIFEAGFAETIQGKEYGEVVNFESRIFEGIIQRAIDDVVEKLAKYDPSHVEHQDITVFGHLGEFANVHLEGFSNIVTTKISLGGLITWTLNLVLEAPLIKGSVENWNVTGDVFYGEGAGSVILENIKITVKATINPITQYIKTLKVTPAIGNAEVSITGIYNDDPEFAQWLSDHLEWVLNDWFNNNTDLHDKISEKLLEILRNNMF